MDLNIAHKDLREFLELLNLNNVRYLVVGGYAVSFHGYPRYTGDLDIFAEVTQANAQLIVKTFKDFGFDTANLRVGPFLYPKNIVEIGREPVKIQISTYISGVTFEECYPRRYEVVVQGIKIPFIGFDDLIKNKLAAGRGKDLIDVEHLQSRKHENE